MKINLTKGDEKVIINSQKTLFGGAKKTEKIIGT
jgi:ribosomal protein L13